ncbi:hypothetical protein AA16663_1074 [Komagataeibacter rhaeticus DSM 16663]|nr:hypothetical protein AA16663_1074 [Komagataeibacter rhaeticus DSM 16663]
MARPVTPSALTPLLVTWMVSATGFASTPFVGAVPVVGLALVAGGDMWFALPWVRACGATAAVWARVVTLCAMPMVDRAVLAARIFVIRQLINGFTLY